jgi:hypothetical protein
MDPYRFYTYMWIVDKYPKIEIIQLCFVEGLATWHTPKLLNRLKCEFEVGTTEK